MDINDAANLSVNGATDKRQPYPQCIEVTRLARAYVPMQQMGAISSPEKGLLHGTIYPELYMPYEPGCRHGKDDKEAMFF